MSRQTAPRARLSCVPLEERSTPSFGVNGMVVTDLPASSSEEVYGTALQADGKIVAAGAGGVARYNPDGSLDATFNAGGPLPGTLTTAGFVYDVAVQTDGKIVVGGLTGPVSNYDFYLQRFLPDGTSDPSFGTGGVVRTGFKKGGAAYDAISAIAVQPDDKVVAVGRMNGMLWGVARDTAAGALDNTFSGDGWLTDAFDKGMSSNELPRAVAVQPDGMVVVVGHTYRPATNWDFTIVRYTPNGALDASFGSGGKAFVDFGAEHGQSFSTDRAYSLALQSDGKVVVNGSSGGLALTRLNPNGSLDPTFAGDGRLVVVPPGWGSVTTNGPAGLAIQADGAIVAVWNTGGSAVVARFTPAGSADRSFDGDGWKWFEFAPGASSRSNDVLIQPDGKILIGGGDRPDGSSVFALARLNADGTFDDSP